MLWAHPCHSEPNPSTPVELPPPARAPETGLCTRAPASPASCSSGPRVPGFAALCSSGLQTHLALLALYSRRPGLCLSCVLISCAVIPCCLSWWSRCAVQLLDLCHERTLGPEWARGPQEPGPAISRVPALPQASAQDARGSQGQCRVRGGLEQGPGVGRELFRELDPPRLALMRNADLDLLF